MENRKHLSIKGTWNVKRKKQTEFNETMLQLQMTFFKFSSANSYLINWKKNSHSNRIERYWPMDYQKPNPSIESWGTYRFKYNDQNNNILKTPNYSFDNSILLFRCAVSHQDVSNHGFLQLSPLCSSEKNFLFLLALENSANHTQAR